MQKKRKTIEQKLNYCWRDVAGVFPKPAQADATMSRSYVIIVPSDVVLYSPGALKCSLEKFFNTYQEKRHPGHSEFYFTAPESIALTEDVFRKLLDLPAQATIGPVPRPSKVEKLQEACEVALKRLRFLNETDSLISAKDFEDIRVAMEFLENALKENDEI